MSKLQVTIGKNGFVFLRETSKGALQAVDGDFAFVEPVSDDVAVDTLKREVSARGNVTRAALSALFHIFQSPRMDGYRGVGDINAEDGAKIVKEAKTALRDAESAYFMPLFKDTKKFDTFLTGIRDAGIYATVKGVALKYFYFAGKLPCFYDGDNAQGDKLLSVSTMQKLLQNMIEETTKDDSIATRVLQLHSEANERTDWTLAELQLLLGNLDKFADEIVEKINSINANATDKTENTLPQPKTDAEYAAAINAAWDKEPADIEEEALI